MGTKKPNGYWSKENCHKEALKYNNKHDFKEQSGVAYSKASEMGWLKDICSHMNEGTSEKGYWNSKENCHAAALQCKTRSEFSDRFSAGYASSIRHGWLDDICSHMTLHMHTFTREDCEKAANDCQSRTEFMDRYPHEYS